MTLNSWDRRYLAVAMQVSHWSKDPSSKMGAVIANTQQRLVALGYNGFPKQVEDCQRRLHNKR
jgi:dCMP deaminase